MSLPPEWTAVTGMTPPSRWAELADRIALLEHGIDCHRELLAHVLGMVQERLPTAAENDALWWECEKLRAGVDRVPSDVEKLDELLRELFNEFGPKVLNSVGTRNVRWREGPWHTLEPGPDDDD